MRSIGHIDFRIAHRELCRLNVFARDCVHPT